MHSVSVAGVVVRSDERLLAIERADNGGWEPPGGILEPDEDFEAGVRREVLEETGLAVQVGPLTGVYKNMGRGIVALVFRCAVVSGELRLSDETTAVEWLTPDEVRARAIPAYACRFLDALSAVAPLVRTHDGYEILSRSSDE